VVLSSLSIPSLQSVGYAVCETNIQGSGTRR
jgi:hypothetical protein